MEAVHVRTYGMHCGQCTQEVERILSGVDGVAASIAVRSLDVTSVLFEPLVTTPETIADAIRSAGFEAEVVPHSDNVAAAA